MRLQPDLAAACRPVRGRLWLPAKRCPGGEIDRIGAARRPPRIFSLFRAFAEILVQSARTAGPLPQSFRRGKSPAFARPVCSPPSLLAHDACAGNGAPRRFASDSSAVLLLESPLVKAGPTRNGEFMLPRTLGHVDRGRRPRAHQLGLQQHECVRASTAGETAPATTRTAPARTTACTARAHQPRRHERAHPRQPGRDLHAADLHAAVPPAAERRRGTADRPATAHRPRAGDDNALDRAALASLPLSVRGDRPSQRLSRRTLSRKRRKSLLGDQLAERLAQQRRRLRADAVHLAVLRLLPAVAERRLLVPLPLREDVADLVVGQADRASGAARVSWA